MRSTEPDERVHRQFLCHQEADFHLEVTCFVSHGPLPLRSNLGYSKHP